MIFKRLQHIIEMEMIQDKTIYCLTIRLLTCASFNVLFHLV